MLAGMFLYRFFNIIIKIYSNFEIMAVIAKKTKKTGPQSK